MTRESVWFVTPAWGRFDLTDVCLEQRRDVVARLATEGIEVNCVVIADDQNLDIARDHGFDVLERDNDWLGRRFNDGIEYAAHKGATRIVPIGSDSWIDPAYFFPLPLPRETLTSPLYCHVTADKLLESSVDDDKGAGPYVFHKGQLRANRFRPAKDEIHRGVDGSTIKGIRYRLRWVRRELHPFQYVGFRVPPYLTGYEALRDAWGIREHANPWSILAEHYPVGLVERARDILTAQEAAA